MNANRLAERRPLVFVVDDDTELLAMLDQYLTRHGMEAMTAASADEALRRLPRRRPDLLVLDLMLPGTDGLAALRRLRADGDDLPVILLTGRDEDIDRILGLEMGADDYLGKPFNPRELLARIQAVLRRRGGLPGGTPVVDGERIAIGGALLDTASRTLIRDGITQALSTADFALLQALIGHAGRPLTRERLIELTRGGSDADCTERAIDVRVLRLRRLIEDHPQLPRLIQTVRGVGYVYVPASA
ncbi:MAG: hypothetical protein JWQ90_4721 [Hydrocarboniphaga sp.]|uniref:response regulator n=1 Tax=Hydrocarboniphaga sp. TaxID=2033016 RepID=UPI00260D1A25|nr:response regulator [Hydrocarboniphaga sp.]MDB5972271.1 hypothetical protein [Hydrocarboniphaga sp.]